MLNISKWIYFYLIIITHRKIRYDEIDAAIMQEDENYSKEQKQRHLSQLERKNKFLNIVVVVLATALSSIYLGFAIRYFIDMTNPSREKTERDYR